MIKKLQSIINNYFPLLFGIALILIWQGVSDFGIMPKFMLPSPTDVISAFINDLPALALHSVTTLTEAFLGLGIGIVLSFIMAYLMDRFSLIHRAVYPLLVITQTIPTVAIAPLLVLWLGYGMAPKITLVVIVCFFPITIGLLDGFKQADNDTLNLMHAMGANNHQIFRHVKLPFSMPYFFAGLRVSASYAMVGAVIAEWLGGFSGLGVYMIRVKKSYSFDKMFAVILLISIISLILMKIVSIIQKKVIGYNVQQKGL